MVNTRETYVYTFTLGRNNIVQIGYNSVKNQINLNPNHVTTNQFE